MTVPVLTPAEMTFLIGSRYLPLATITDPRILAVAAGIKGDGNLNALAANVITAGFIALHDEGSVTLAYVEAKKLGMFTTKHAMITRTGQPSAYPPPCMEAQLFAAVSGEARSATKVLGSWFGPQVERPAVKAYLPAVQRLMACGVLRVVDHEVERGRISAVLSHSATKTAREAEPDPEIIAAVLRQIAQWADRWAQFQASDAAVVQRLLSEARELVASKLTSDNEND
jgi:hypothetical protein